MKNTIRFICLYKDRYVKEDGSIIIKDLLKETPCWTISHETKIPHLIREFEFSDFASSLEFVNQVGVDSDKQDHHPKIVLEWGLVRVEWWTHSIGGLHINDFIMAFRCDRIYE